MQRSTLQPLRTRRMFVSVTTTATEPAPEGPTPATRQTIGAIGALWVSFAASANGERRPTPAKDTPAVSVA